MINSINCSVEAWTGATHTWSTCMVIGHGYLPNQCSAEKDSRAYRVLLEHVKQVSTSLSPCNFSHTRVKPPPIVTNVDQAENHSRNTELLNCKCPVRISARDSRRAVVVLRTSNAMVRGPLFVSYVVHHRRKDQLHITSPRYTKLRYLDDRRDQISVVVEDQGMIEGLLQR